MAPAFLGGTLTNYGDYDQCLDINLGRLTGQFCDFNLYPVNPLPREEEDADLESTGFKGVSLAQSLCVPTSCDFVEINAIVQESKCS